MEKKRVRGSGKHREKHPQTVQSAGISGLQMCPSGLPSPVPRTESCRQLSHGAQTRGHSLCLISLSCDEGIHGSLSGANASSGQLVPDVPGSKELMAQRTEVAGAGRQPQGRGLKRALELEIT